MSSKKPSADLDLESGLPTTTEDVAALRAAAAHPPMSPAEYLRFLSQFTFDQKALRERRGPQGEPFTLFP